MCGHVMLNSIQLDHMSLLRPSNVRPTVVRPKRVVWRGLPTPSDKPSSTTSEMERVSVSPMCLSEGRNMTPMEMQGLSPNYLQRLSDLN